MSITTIINYCTNDYRFLRLCIEEAQKFSSQIIVPVCTHFFNGEPESRELLEKSYREHPDVEFVEFVYDETPYGIYSTLTSDHDDWSHYWHSTARYVGYHFVKDVDYVLFLDVDEIIEGDRFIEWMKWFSASDFTAVRLEGYFYFRTAENRAIDCFQPTGLVVRKNAIDSHEMLLDVEERRGNYHLIQGRKQYQVRGLNGKPLVHHYSWVRTEEELKKKVTTWGHRYDKEWLALIDDELSHPFRGQEKVHGLKYKTVKPYCDPLAAVSVKEKFDSPRVQKIDRHDLVKLRFL